MSSKDDIKDVFNVLSPADYYHVVRWEEIREGRRIQRHTIVATKEEAEEFAKELSERGITATATDVLRFTGFCKLAREAGIQGAEPPFVATSRVVVGDRELLVETITGSGVAMNIIRDGQTLAAQVVSAAYAVKHNERSYLGTGTVSRTERGKERMSDNQLMRVAFARAGANCLAQVFGVPGAEDWEREDMGEPREPEELAPSPPEHTPEYTTEEDWQKVVNWLHEKCGIAKPDCWAVIMRAVKEVGLGEKYRMPSQMPSMPRSEAKMVTAWLRKEFEPKEARG